MNSVDLASLGYILGTLLACGIRWKTFFRLVKYLWEEVNNFWQVVLLELVYAATTIAIIAMWFKLEAEGKFWLALVSGFIILMIEIRHYSRQVK